MTSKKGGKATASLTALKIGSRVRCADDRVEGRIVWANAVSVKVQWDDGEHVTWRRDSLAGRPIEILPPADPDEPAATNPEPADAGQDESVEVPGAEQSSIPHAPEADTAQPEQPTADTTAPAVEPATEQPVSPAPGQAEGQPLPASPDTTATTDTIASETRRTRSRSSTKHSERSSSAASASVR